MEFILNGDKGLGLLLVVSPGSANLFLSTVHQRGINVDVRSLILGVVRDKGLLFFFTPLRSRRNGLKRRKKKIMKKQIS